MMNKYAKLIVKRGINLQENQILVIDASIEHAMLVREITKVAYENKARDVIVNYHDQYISYLRYKNNNLDFFNSIPNYIKELRNQYTSLNACFLSIIGDDPEGLKGIEASKLQAYSIAYHKACKPYYDGMDLGINRWCIVGAPTLRWANKVYPEQSDKEALESLWNAIYKVCYVNKEDPVLFYDSYRRSFEARVNYLNKLNIKELHYTNSKGTNLYVGMNKNYLFAGGGSYTRDGIYSFPNIPTVEIFTSPCFNLVNGRVYNTLPLYYNGNVVDDFYLDFKDGRVVNYKAKTGQEILASIIETDNGSHYLGEIALVPYDSPISNMKTLFYNTLFDENASCHIALGKGFSECIKDGLNMNKEQLLEKGINDSLTHVDFMIGSEDLHIDAKLDNNEIITIFDKGNWGFNV